MAVLKVAALLMCMVALLCSGQETTEETTSTSTATEAETTTVTTTTTTTTTTGPPPIQKLRVFTVDEMLYFRAKGVIFETVSNDGFVNGSTSIADLLEEIASLKSAIAEAQSTLAQTLSTKIGTLNEQLAGSSTMVNTQLSSLSTLQSSSVSSVTSTISSTAASIGTRITTTTNTLNSQMAALSTSASQNRADVDARVTTTQASLSTSVSTVNQRITDTSAPINTEASLTRSTANTKIDSAAYIAKTDSLSTLIATLTSRANGVDAAITDARASITKNANDIASTATILTATKTEVDKLAVPLRIEIQSAGACLGNYFNIWINGDINAVNFATGPAFFRGINTVTVDATSGLPLVRNTFDTCCGANPAAEVARLISYLNGLPNGQIVLFGIIDEGVNSLSDEARRVISGFGSKLIGHINYRESWAMIGVKGATPGSVPEDHGGDDFNPNCPSPATGRTTAKLQALFFSGKLAWYNTEYNRRSALETYSKVQRRDFFAGDGCRDTWCTSRQMAFTKYHDDSILKITWYDNFRCEGAGGVSCRWDVYIDGFMCVSDGQYQTGPMRMDIYHATSLNIHRGSTVIGYCKAIHNGAILRAGQHLLQVWERGSPQHTHGNPYLGWNNAIDYPGGNTLTQYGTYATITIEEVF